MTALSSDSMSLRVQEVTSVAENVVAIEFASLGAATLPPFSAGAHIDLHLRSGLVRQYSLCSDPEDTTRYVVAVALDPASRGGSSHIHEHVRGGQVLTVGMPRNNFPLAEDAPATVMVAGGIGITPFVAMARRLAAIGRPWTLYLCARTPERAAFLPELLALRQGRVVPVYDGMPGVASLNLAEVVRQAPAGTHFYCCGPAALMRAFNEATRGLEPHRVHTEWFAAPLDSGQAPVPSAGFDVKLQRSAKVLHVAESETLLEVLERHGVPIASSCRDGICGTCEVRVLGGTPEHRDLVLSQAEQARGDRMLACVSRCRGAELVLDL